MDKTKTILGSFKKPLMISIVLMILCGLLFPILLSGISAVIFPRQAKGSLVEVNGEAVGAEYVGQKFTEPYFMKGRPSAVEYNTYDEEAGEEASLASGSANYGATNPELKKRVEEDMDAFLAENPGVKKEDIPTDLMTASGSGLDPHISPASAMIQIPAISRASGISETDLKRIVEDHTEGKLLGIFGEETVNVLGVNVDIAETMKEMH